MEENISSEPQARRSFNPIVIVIVLILLIGAGALLLSNSRKALAPAPTPTQDTSPTAMKEASPTAAMKLEASPSGAMEGKVQEVTVHGGSYYFKPKAISVKKGDTVRVTFINDAGFHDFVLDEFNVKTDVIGTGKSATVTFTANKAGTFQYYCSVAKHKAMGMVGTLTVQ